MIHDPEFVAGKPLRKQNLEKELREKQDLFINHVKKLAEASMFPWHCETDACTDDFRSMGGEISQVRWQVVSFTVKFWISHRDTPWGKLFQTKRHQ